MIDVEARADAVLRRYLWRDALVPALVISVLAALSGYVLGYEHGWASRVCPAVIEWCPVWLVDGAR